MKNIDFTDFFNVFLSGATIRQSLCFCVICAVFFDVCANSIDPVNASLYDSFVKKI